MTTYRKKPVEVEAFPVSKIVNAAPGEAVEMPDWLMTAMKRGEVIIKSGGGLDVRTLEGWLTAGVDDMLICGVKGEVYPCKPDIFAATYEAVGGW